MKNCKYVEPKLNHCSDQFYVNSAAVPECGSDWRLMMSHKHQEGRERFVTRRRCLSRESGAGLPKKSKLALKRTWQGDKGVQCLSEALRERHCFLLTLKL